MSNEIESDKLEKQLQVAVDYGEIDQVKQLLDQGVDINARLEFGGAPLHFAAANNAFNMVKYLLEQGANIDAVNDSNRTTLHLVALLGYSNIAQILLDHYPDIYIKDGAGKTAMDLAREYDHPDLAEFIVSYKQSRQEQDHLSDTIITDDESSTQYKVDF